MRGYCGCCGRSCELVNDYWCRDCSKHVGPWRYGEGPWERTYFALHNAPCPFDVSTQPAQRAAGVEDA